MKESLNLIKDLSKGELLVKAGQVDIDINGVSIDTRTLNKGNIYIPIIGENFDGHDFIEKAAKNGAYATFWDKKHELPNIDIPIILVDDTKIALRTLARGYRLLVNPKVIAITGSNGKTTTKDMLYSSLKTKYKTHATKGNQNNDIGLPLTVLSMEEDTEVLILEMGTESFGEIKILTEIGMPNYALITNIADSHLNVLKTKENVAKEKLDIVKGFVDSGIFYYNNDDPILRKKTLEILKGLDIKSIGKKEGSDFLIEDVEKTELGTSFKINGEEINLNLKGDHQVYNAAMAYAVLQNFNLNTKEINDAINNTEFTKMRNDCIKLKKIKLLDDSYKSNPQNLKAAIETLLEDKDPKRHILILSDMLDLGENSKQLHYMVKDFLTDEIDLVLATGNESKEIIRGAKEVLGEDKAIFFESKKELIHSLKELILEGDYVLVKGSRAMRMEEVVDYLKENF